MVELRYPVCIVGKEDVGKTSICDRFCNDKFEADYRATLGSQIFSKDMVISGSHVKLLIWDTGGQGQYLEEAKMYIKQAYAVALAFSVADMGSFVSLKRWVEDIRSFGSKDPVIVLVGNKIDLREKDDDCITSGQIEKLGNVLKVDGVIETSAKSGENISKVFQIIAQLCDGRESFTRMSFKEAMEY